MSLRIYITDTDQKVLNFVEKFGSITISQAQKMFYNTQKYGYDIARRRMRKLVLNNKLKVSRDLSGNENVYYMEKKLSYHDLLALDYHAELINRGAKVLFFKPRQYWMNNTCISDAYCCYTLGNKVFFNIVEVVRTHGVDKEKYLALYKSGEPQKINSLVYKQIGGGEIDEFPRLVLIDNVTHSKKLFIHENIKIHQLDFSLSGFSELFV